MGRFSRSSPIANASRWGSQKSCSKRACRSSARACAGRRRRLVPVRCRQRGGGPPRGIGVGLHLRERDRRLGEPSVGEAHAVVRVLPSLVHERSRSRRSVFDVSVPVAVAGPFEPTQRRLDGGPEQPDLLDRRAPAPELVNEHHEQWSDVRRSVVDVSVRQGERRSSREPNLVQDPPRLLVALRVVPNPLHSGQAAGGPQPDVRVDQQRHPGSQDRVAAEERHVPGGPGRDQQVLGVVRVDQLQGPEVLAGP